jgi:hypothetical protein
MSNFSEQIDRDMGWDEEILEESSYKLISDGDCDFVVKTFERGIHEPKEGGTLPRCNKATLSIELTNAAGEKATVEHRLFLCKSQEWKLSEFFKAIGQKKHGEAAKMNWSAVPGSRGRCKVGHREYNGNTYNDIKKFYDPEEKATSRASTGFTPGNF